MAVVSLSGELLSAAVVQTRNKEIAKLMENESNIAELPEMENEEQDNA